MTSPLTMAVYRPAGRLGLYVRAFQVFAATQSAGASVLDFGGGDMSVPVCFGDLRFHEPPHQAAPVIAAAVSPRLGTRARGSAAALGHAGHRANPARPRLQNAKCSPPANITSSGENANAKPG